MQRIGQPYERPGRGWYYQVDDRERGPYKTQRAAKSAIARSRNKEHAEALSRAVGDELGMPEGQGLQWWSSALRLVATRVMSGAGAAARGDLKAIAAAALAAQRLHDLAEAEQRLAELEERVALMRSREKHGTGIRGAGSRPGQGAVAGEAVH